jgi:hypothetical protein
VEILPLRQAFYSVLLFSEKLIALYHCIATKVVLPLEPYPCWSHATLTIL